MLIKVVDLFFDFVICRMAWRFSDYVIGFAIAGSRVQQPTWPLSSNNIVANRAQLVGAMPQFETLPTN